MDKQTILKYLTKSLSSSEEVEVEEWVASSKDNSKFFNKIKSEFVIDSFAATDGEISVDDKFERFKNKYLTKKPAAHRVKWPILKYAAMIAVIFSISFLVYRNQRQVNTTSNSITLKLENGEVISIDDLENTLVKDSKGNILGTQEDGTLLHTNAGFTKEIAYNTISVPYGKTFKLKLSDGTLVHIGTGSSLRYPVQFPEIGKRNVSVVGEVYLDVAKDPLRPFIVNTGDLNIRVLGTSFNVNNYPEDKISQVVLVEGLVDLYDADQRYNANRSSRLEPGYEASYDKETNVISKKVVDTHLSTSWINGELVFRNEPLGNILKKLEKHYDVHIKNENGKLSKEKYFATFSTKSSIEKIMENLKVNYGIQYEINGKQITIK